MEGAVPELLDSIISEAAIVTLVPCGDYAPLFDAASPSPGPFGFRSDADSVSIRRLSLVVQSMTRLKGSWLCAQFCARSPSISVPLRSRSRLATRVKTPCIYCYEMIRRQTVKK